LRIKGALRVWQRNLTVYKKLFLTSMVLNFVEPLLYLTAMGLGLGAFVSNINGVPYIKFIAPGMIASSAMFAAAYESTYGTYVRMTFQKTFDAVLATPVGVDEITIAEIFWGAFKCVLFGCTIMIVIAAFGLVDSPALILALPVIGIAGIMISEISIIFCTVVKSIELFNYFFTLFLTPMFLFSGIFFPLDGMPRFVSVVASFTPLYHLVNVCRGCAAGNFSALPVSILYLALGAVLLCPIAILLMRRRLVL